MDFLRYEQAGPVVTLTLDRPATRNALSGADAIESVMAACERINGDSEAKVAILTGAGSAFSSGGDVKAMHAQLQRGLPAPAVLRREYVSGIQRLAIAVHELEVPLIAAINGPAMGAGLDLACMCDIRIASTTARFAESFVRLGLVAGDGGAWLLPRVVGRSMACTLAFTGDVIDAEQALRCGLVSAVVAPQELLATAHDLARRIAANPGGALRLIKRLLREADDCDFRSALRSAAALQSIAQHASDYRDAVESAVRKMSAGASRG